MLWPKSVLTLPLAVAPLLAYGFSYSPALRTPNTATIISATAAPVAAAPAAPRTPPLHIVAPRVCLSASHAATCQVGTGNPFPTAQLVDLNGEPQQLDQLFGKRLTVALFWTAKRMRAVEELEDLNAIVAQFADRGVAVVGIHVRGDAAKAQKRLQQAGANFPNLHDPQGDYFAQVATEKLPRVYLLDADGKILWFDVEYSTETRRTLQDILHKAFADSLVAN